MEPVLSSEGERRGEGVGWGGKRAGSRGQELHHKLLVLVLPLPVAGLGLPEYLEAGGRSPEGPGSAASCPTALLSWGGFSPGKHRGGAFLRTKGEVSRE